MDVIGYVILHYGRIEDTIASLSSFSRVSPSDRIYVVYDPSRSGKLADRLKSFERVYGVSISGNLGYSGGMNRGLNQAYKDSCSWFLLMNNDVIVSKTFFPSVRKEVSSLSRSAIFSPKIYFEKGQEYHRSRYSDKEQGKVIWYAGGCLDWNTVLASHVGVDLVDNGQFDSPSYTDFATGCCMGLSRQAVERVGYFDERYFLYYEDVDYSIRARKSGFSIRYVPGIYLWHKNAASSGKPGSNLHRYYQTRNRLYFGMKYSTLRTKLALFRESMRMILNGGICRRGALDYFAGRMGKQLI